MGDDGGAMMTTMLIQSTQFIRLDIDENKMSNFTCKCIATSIGCQQKLAKLNISDNYFEKNGCDELVRAISDKIELR